MENVANKWLWKYDHEEGYSGIGIYHILTQGDQPRQDSLFKHYLE